MSLLYEEYRSLLIFVMGTLIITVMALVISYIFISRDVDIEKSSTYECGFIPFGEARSKFDVRFYLVSILFLVFDLEVVYIFVWPLAFNEVGLFGFYVVSLFIVILGVGFLYEWGKGALEWE